MKRSRRLLYAELTLMLTSAAASCFLAYGQKGIDRETFFAFQTIFMLTGWVCGLLAGGYFIFIEPFRAKGLKGCALKTASALLGAAAAFGTAWLIASAGGTYV
ncbi:MAG: hypothetical protein NC120_01045 [Ruminococcus sp.]|nr:hypothetical protein [Ruminococcus sp.]